MKITELLISIVIFSLVMIASFTCYVTFMKNQNRVLEETKNAESVLEIDNQIRKKIESCKIPYYENSEKKVELFMQQLLYNNYFTNCEVVNSCVIMDKNKNFVGLEVEWKYKEKLYKTKELFSSGLVFLGGK